MFRAIASLLGRSGGEPSVDVRPMPDHAEVERRRQVLRAAVLGFPEAATSREVRSDLARGRYDLRVDDISNQGVSGWAPVNTWALHPRPRREVWMVYRDRADPWMSDAHVFATLDNATLLAATLMPTRLAGRDEALMLRTEFSLVRHQSDLDLSLRENAAARLDGRVPAIWSAPSRWSVPEEAWLPAADEACLGRTLAKLVSGMVATLERAGPARDALAA